MEGPDLLVWRDFERDLRVANRSPRTIQSYEEAAQQLIDFTAGRWCHGVDCEHELHDAADLEAMSKQHIQEYLLEVINRHSDTTASVRFRSLRRFFNWMVTEEIIEQSPMRRITEPEPEKKPTKIPPIEDVRKLLATCEPRTRSTGPRRRFNDLRDAAIIRLFSEPGSPRVSEMAGIEVVNIDMRIDTVTFKGKGNKWRAISFSNRTGRAISRYMRERPNHPLVQQARRKDPTSDGPQRMWLGWRSKPLDASGVYQMVERRCEEAGVAHIHPHQLRHLATHRFYAAGGTEQEAMFLFGWASKDMAHHYAAELADKRAMDASRRLAIGDQL